LCFILVLVAVKAKHFQNLPKQCSAGLHLLVEGEASQFPEVHQHSFRHDKVGHGSALASLIWGERKTALLPGYEQSRSRAQSSPSRRQGAGGTSSSCLCGPFQSGNDSVGPCCHGG